MHDLNSAGDKDGAIRLLNKVIICQLKKKEKSVYLDRHLCKRRRSRSSNSKESAPGRMTRGVSLLRTELEECCKRQPITPKHGNRSPLASWKSMLVTRREAHQLKPVLKPWTQLV